MGKTSAECQAKFRESRPPSGVRAFEERRLNLWVSLKAIGALGSLAYHYGIKKRTLIERLLLEEQARVLGMLGSDYAAIEKYFEAGVPFSSILHSLDKNCSEEGNEMLVPCDNESPTTSEK